MNYLYFLLLMMFAGPLVRSVNYYLPGVGSLIYWGILFYMFYSSYKQSRNFQRRYNTNDSRTYRSQYDSQYSQNTSNSNDARVKSDVIDVEFSEREVE